MRSLQPKTSDLVGWSVLDSRKVFEAGDRLRVLRQTISLPDSRIVDDYYQIDLPSFASIYAVTDQDEVLILQQYKHGVGQTCLTLPGGQIDACEDPEFSARRELLEETGYGGGKWVAAPTMVLHGNQKIAKSHVFIASHVIKLCEANSGDLETSTLLTVPRKEVRRSMLSGKTPIASHVAAIGLAEMYLAD